MQLKTGTAIWLPILVTIPVRRHDRGFLALGVGYGGSMLCFGSSARVALSNMFPEAKSAGNWLRHGWHVAVAYVVAFMLMVALIGWQPIPLSKKTAETRSHQTAVVNPTPP